MENSQRKEKYKFTEVKINSLKGFTTFRSILNKIHHYYFFRGQSKAEWPLTTHN